MNSVIKKTKKTLLTKIIGKIKADPLSNDKRDMDYIIPLDNNRTYNEDMALIAFRRNELKSVKHDGSDTMVTVRDNNQTSSVI
jgi:hypothetical protein